MARRAAGDDERSGRDADRGADRDADRDGGERRRDPRGDAGSRAAQRDRLLRALASALADRPGTVVLWNGRLELGLAGRPRCRLALLRGAEPTLGRVLLAVAVGEGRDPLLAACAAAEVPLVWVLDLQHELVEVYRAPADGRYRVRELAFPGEALSLPEGAGRVVAWAPRR